MQLQISEFFGIALGAEVEGVWLATNGKKKKDAIKLAKLAFENEYFSVALSQDPWHEPIKQEVINIFNNFDLEIRDVSQGYYGEKITNIGSAYENGIGTTDECACPGFHIDPDGTVKMCGCLDSLKIGHVSDIDSTTLDRANYIHELTGTECGRDLDQEYIDYIIDNIKLEDAA